LAALFAILLGFQASPSLAQGAGVEDEAALLLFKEGKDLYKQGAYEAALERFIGASAVVKKDVLTFFLGMTYAKLGRHNEAIFFLGPLAGKVPPDAERQRQEAETAALWGAAKDAIQKKDCVSATPCLNKLKGRLSGEAELLRKEHESACRHKSTAFTVETSKEKAAHKLFLEARRLRDLGRSTRALALYQKVRALVDTLIVHEETFSLMIELGMFPEAAKVAEPISELWHHSDGRGDEFEPWWLWYQVVTDFAPQKGLKGEAAQAYLRDVASVLKAASNDEGSSAGQEEEQLEKGPYDLGALDKEHEERLMRALVAGQSTPLLGLRLDALAAAKSCPSYHKVREDGRLRRILPMRHRSPDQRCVALGPNTKGGVKMIANPAQGAGKRRYLGWSLIGSGALFAAGSGYFVYKQMSNISQMEDFTNEYNALSDTEKRAQGGVLLASEAQAAHSWAKEHQTWAMICAGVSLLSLGVGVYFVLTEPGGSARASGTNVEPKDGVSWMPMIGPRGGGVYGRF